MKVYFSEDGSIEILFPSPVKLGSNLLFYFGDIRGIDVLVKNGKAAGLRFSDERALRMCEKINGFPSSDEILALMEVQKSEKQF